MPERYLIVSNPPHETIDLPAAAGTLGMSVADFRMKTNFPAPEIWSAHDDIAAAQQEGQALLDAGLRVAMVPGEVLDKVPAAFPVSAISSEGGAFSVTAGADTLTIDKQDRVVVVVSETLPQERRSGESRSSILTQKIDQRGPLSSLGGIATGGVVGAASYAAGDKLDQLKEEAKQDMKKQVGQIQEAPTAVLSLDIYAYTSNGWQAARMIANQADFSELGALKQPTAKANVQKILDTLKQNFENAKIDERLMKVSHRSYSVGGVALSRVLAEVSEELGNMLPAELATRLVFLTVK
jgi:hypothetical protein